MWRETIAVDSFGDFDDISTHSLRVERDQIVSEDSLQKAVFQPTLSVWRETSANWYPRFTARHFNPLSPCGERQRRHARSLCTSGFQPTLSVWRETISLPFAIPAKINFNPLSPCGERHGKTILCMGAEGISTHSLRVERD